MNRTYTINNGSAVCLAAVAALSLLTLTGCSPSGTDQPAPISRTTVIMPANNPGGAPTATVTSAEMPAATPSAPISDTNAGPGGATGAQSGIADRINAAIVHNTQMTGSRVTALVDSSGVATLNGFVQNAQQKALAEKAAHDTPGVLRLKDKLEIRPTGGAGKTAARVVTSLSDGDQPVAAAPASTPATPNAAPSPRVVVVNNYVPVPQPAPQDGSQGNAPTVNVTVTPPDNSGNGGGYGYRATNGNYANNPNSGTGNFTGSDGYTNYAPGGEYGYNPAYTGQRILNRDFVPDYLRNMNDANNFNNYVNNTYGNTNDSGQ